MRRALWVLGYAVLAALVWLFALGGIDGWHVRSASGWLACIGFIFAVAATTMAFFSKYGARMRRDASVDR